MTDQDKGPVPPQGKPEPTNETNSPVQPTPEPAPESSIDEDAASILASRQTLLVPHGNSGRTCPNCGNVNRPGILVCEKCGTLMLGEERPGSTKRFEGAKPEGEVSRTATVAETAEIASLAVSTAGSNRFTDNMVLRLEIEGAPTPILLHPKTETSIGRRDPATGTMPDVDLSAYAGYRLGVSRKHAIIRYANEQLELFDLGSSNGTSVNGDRMTPHAPHVLRDGDEVILGKMIMRVLFQLRSRRR